MNDLRELFEELERADAARGAAPVFEAATQSAVRKRRTRMRRRLLSVFAAGVVLAVAAGVIAQQDTAGPSKTRVHNRGLSNATAAQLAAGHWEIIPPAPITERDDASVVWTGKEVIVWSTGSEMHKVGAAYNPNTRSWRMLPSAPDILRVFRAAVWTGNEIVLTGDSTFGFLEWQSAAAYNPTTNAWRKLPAPSLWARSTFGVWNGDRAVFFTGAQAASYDPVTNRWRQLPAPTPTHEPLSWQLAVAAGPGRVLAWSVSSSRTQTGPNSYFLTGGTDLFRYDEATNRWTALASDPDAISIPEEAFWIGNRALVRGDMHMLGAHGPGPLPEVSAWYDADTGSVTRLPDDALTANDIPASHFSSAWTGKALWSLNAQGAAGPIRPGDASVYDATANTWSRLPRAPFGCGGSRTTPVWTGATIIVYCSKPFPNQQAPVGGLEFVPGTTG